MEDLIGAKEEVSNNYNFFQEKLPELQKYHLGKFALLHKRQIIDYFVSEDDAINIGIKDYGEGCFSVQEVANQVIDLGYQSHVIL